MRKHKNKIITGFIIGILLAFVLWYGGDAPILHGWEIASEETSTAGYVSQNKKTQEKDTKLVTDKQDKNSQEISSVAQIDKQNAEALAEQETPKDESQDKYQTEPAPSESQDAVITDKELTCTLSVRCDTIINNIEWLDAEKVDIVPRDGIIFAEKTVVFCEGESVFDLLIREMKKNKIHIEFENTPIYNSAYIEGIANLYEFDCGELSGWMYKVNGWFPNYGCSRYQLKAGDKVEWVYTCDLGADVGGNYSSGNGN